MGETKTYGLLSYPTFPTAAATLTAAGAVEDFTRFMALDELTVEVPSTVVSDLERRLGGAQVTAAQRVQMIVAAMRPCFEEANRALAARGVEARWAWLYTATRARNDVTWRWYKLTPAEQAASEREGALTFATFSRNLAVRTSAAVVFYVLLAAGWARPSTFLYAAAGASFAVYLLLRWRLPIRPKRP